jgi:polyhydroxyalkanoate synthase subunit PhaC
MAESETGPTGRLPDPTVVAQQMANIAERSQRVVQEFLLRQSRDKNSLGMGDPFNIGQTFLEMTRRIMANPAKLAEAQFALWGAYVRLWQSTALKSIGKGDGPLASPSPGDRRFSDPAWDENFLFDYVKQSYLLTARWMQATVKNVDGLDDKTARKLDFYTRQFVDAMAPSNFAVTNPEVLRATFESGGENLLKGLSNLLTDLERGKGKLAIRQTDLDAFEVGRNVATSPGKVVFQNDLMQLIQYLPTTTTVARRPVLLIPPWINKFYILDLREKNSFIRWLVAQGLTVFVVSWVNPDAKLAQKTFEDYMLEGPLAAITAIEAATGEREVNAIGYCLGGTLLACALAQMASKGDDRIPTATFLTTMVDFSEAGELSVFIDEEQLAALEERMGETGYLESSAMATTFNMLRANDLIWSFVVNNYLLGKDPFPFDLLYWNSDSTRMPAAMHSFYLRRMYQQNELVKPGRITLAGTPIDLSKIKIPSFLLATREDHIAPWKSTYAATQIFKGPVRFCLAASGHIAGVVNPPESKKYSHWVGDEEPPNPEDWLARAKEVPGSWWPEWAQWLVPHRGGEVPARTPGSAKLKPIEDAPGSYVKVKAAG